MGTAVGKAGDSSLVGPAVITFGTYTELHRTPPGPFAHLFRLPVPDALIDVLDGFAFTGYAMRMSLIGMMEYSGAVVAAVPLLIKLHIASFNDNGTSLSKSTGQFLQTGAINAGECGAAHIHKPCSLFLLQPRIVGQSRGLVFLVKKADLSRITEGNPNGLKSLQNRGRNDFTVLFASRRHSFIMNNGSQR